MSKTVPTTQPVLNIKRAAYAMATADGQSAEITMYGDIYEQQPTDWWGDPVEGQFITLTEFLEDLGQIAACKDITIRMNSYGGDAGVSNTIHNRLSGHGQSLPVPDHRGGGPGRRGDVRRLPYHVRL